MSRNVWWGWLILALLLTSGAAYWWWPRPADEETARYRLAKVTRGAITQQVSANGTLNPVVLVNVGTQVSGVVQHLYADFNDRVKAGQVLARLDPALIQAQLAQSRANLANAQAARKLAEISVNRLRNLFARGYVAHAELDQAMQSLESSQAQIALAQAQVQRDQTNLGYSVITSPVAGVVVSRNVDVGQTVAASFQTPTLFTIAQDLQRLQIDTTVAEADVGGIRVGQAVRFTVDAFPEREFHGKVRQIRLNSQVVQNVVTYNVVIDVANPEELLLPGMTAFVNIILAEHPDVLRLPAAALRFHPAEEPRQGQAKAEHGNNGNGNSKSASRQVYRLHEGQLQNVPVQTGASDSRYSELTGGDVREGDELVVDDARLLKQEEGGGFRMRMF